MSDVQLPKDTLTTLDELKRAIEYVPPHPGDCIPGQNIDRWLAAVHEHRRWALEAWRAAYEWREGVLRRFQEQFFPGQAEAYIAELTEGMALIREKLQS